MFSFVTSAKVTFSFRTIPSVTCTSLWLHSPARSHRGICNMSSSPSQHCPIIPPIMPEQQQQSSFDASDADSRYAEIDGVAVHHKLLSLSNEQSNLPLAVCLHGFGANLSSYELSPQLNNLFSPCIAFDTPGFGLTSRPTSLNLYTSRFSARITRSLALAYSNDINTSNFSTLPPSQNVNPYVLIAHSLGSIAATYATITHPSEILAVILIAPAILPSSSSSPNSNSIINRFLRFLTNAIGSLSVMFLAVLTPLLVPLLRMLVTPESFWFNGLSFARGPNTPPNDQVVNAYRKPIIVDGWEKGILDFTRATFKDRTRALQRRSDLLNDDYIAVLASMPRNIIPPILIVHGDKDKLVPLQNSQKLSELIPKSSLVVMKDVGHMPHEEDPEAFADIVSKFIRQNTNINQSVATSSSSLSDRSQEQD